MLDDIFFCVTFRGCDINSKESANVWKSLHST